MKQFRGNLRSILKKYHHRDVPVFLGTVASNERTHAPFQNGLSSFTDPDVWENAYEMALHADSPFQSIEQIKRVIKMDWFYHESCG